MKSFLSIDGRRPYFSRAKFVSSVTSHYGIIALVLLLCLGPSFTSPASRHLSERLLEDISSNINNNGSNNNNNNSNNNNGSSMNHSTSRSLVSTQHTTKALVTNIRSTSVSSSQSTTAAPMARCGLDFDCGDQCLPKEFVCDTERDCTFGEEERNCPSDCTGANQFHCRDGQCVSKSRICDTYEDCWDGSDESHCRDFPCNTTTHFRCSTSGACIDTHFRCDGTQDCNDHSDEDNC